MRATERASLLCIRLRNTMGIELKSFTYVYAIVVVQSS